MDVHRETISFAYLTSKSKDVVKEQQIKHNEVQIKKFVTKLKTEWNEIHCCYEAGVTLSALQISKVFGSELYPCSARQGFKTKFRQNQNRCDQVSEIITKWRFGIDTCSS